jgi:hypothetical protein
MLFILRQLRRSFFQPGKLKTYVAYAVGEILLIVVGILIAVQIADWNTARAEKALEQRYLERLVLNLERDIERVGFSRALNQLRLQLNGFLLDVSDDSTIAQGRGVEFMTAIRESCYITEPPLYSDTFEELKSTGYLGLIDDELKEKLYSYYREDERSRQFVRVRQDITLGFKQLTVPVLSNKQERFMENNGLEIVFPESMDQVRSMKYDEQEVLEAVERFKANVEMVAYIPLLRDGFFNVIRTQGQTVDLAKEILLDLDAELNKD